MSTETITAWRTRGRHVLGFVAGAERRLAASLRLNDVGMLAAADELLAAAKVALAWLGANPCPDARLGAQIDRRLNDCAEVAQTAQLIATDSASNVEAAKSRLENLAAVINLDVRTLEAW